MATKFVTDISNYGKDFKIIFETDNPRYYSIVLDVVRKMVDGTIVQDEIERLKRENLKIQAQMQLEQALAELHVSPLRFEEVNKLKEWE